MSLKECRIMILFLLRNVGEKLRKYMAFKESLHAVNFLLKGWAAPF